jgi:hypothetical protein
LHRARAGNDKALPVNIEHSLLLTDLYELSMLEAYAAYGMTEIAVFELFVRKLPPERGFLVAAGLEQLIDFLEQLHFTPYELAWLGESGRFAEEFIAGLAGFRFTGDLDALPEGTVFFVDEPNRMPVFRVGRLTIPTPQTNGDAFLAHDACDTLAPDACPVVSKLSVNSWASVRFMALLVDYSNLSCELRILLCTLRRLPIASRIVSGLRRFEK